MAHNILRANIPEASMRALLPDREGITRFLTDELKEDAPSQVRQASSRIRDAIKDIGHSIDVFSDFGLVDGLRERILVPLTEGNTVINGHPRIAAPQREITGTIVAVVPEALIDEDELAHELADNIQLVKTAARKVVELRDAKSGLERQATSRFQELIDKFKRLEESIRESHLTPVQLISDIANFTDYETPESLYELLGELKKGATIYDRSGGKRESMPSQTDLQLIVEQGKLFEELKKEGDPAILRDATQGIATQIQEIEAEFKKLQIDDPIEALKALVGEQSLQTEDIEDLIQLIELFEIAEKKTPSPTVAPEKPMMRLRTFLLLLLIMAIPPVGIHTFGYCVKHDPELAARIHGIKENIALERLKELYAEDPEVLTGLLLGYIAVYNAQHVVGCTDDEVDEALKEFGNYRVIGFSRIEVEAFAKLLIAFRRGEAVGLPKNMTEERLMDLMRSSMDKKAYAERDKKSQKVVRKIDAWTGWKTIDGNIQLLEINGASEIGFIFLFEEDTTGNIVKVVLTTPALLDEEKPSVEFTHACSRVLKPDEARRVKTFYWPTPDGTHAREAHVIEGDCSGITQASVYATPGTQPVSGQ